MPWAQSGTTERGSCRGSIQRRHRHIMLALARDIRPCEPLESDLTESLRWLASLGRYGML